MVEDMDGVGAAAVQGEGSAVLNAGVEPGASSPGETGAAGDGGNDTPAASWMQEHLAPGTRTALAPKNFESVDAMAAAYLNLEKTVGAKGVVLPGENATSEDLDKFYTALGRPAAASAYSFTMPDGEGEMSDSDKAFQSAMAPVLHKAGLSQSQVDVLSAGWNEINAHAAEAYNTQIADQLKTAEAALKNEFGSAYDAKIELGNLTVRQLGGEDLANYLAESGLGRDTRFLKFMIKAGEALSGDGELIDGVSVGGISSPADAKSEIAKLKNDPDFQKVFIDQHHREHAAAVQRLQRLHALAGGAGGVG